jgi:hypothetical protein
MKVHELIKLLSSCDADAEVTLIEQPNYPLEHAVAGVALRGDLCDEDGRPRRCNERDGSAPNDVLLVEGTWLRYGDHAAWRAAARRR